MSYASEVLADSPLAWYRCQEVSGLIQDSSGNGRNATASFGTAQYHEPSPILSDAADFSIYFDGDATFDIPDVGVDVADVFSLEVWVKRTTTGIFEALFWKGIGAYSLAIGSDNKIVLQNGGVADIAKSDFAITDTLWHHVVATKNAAVSAKVYVDGVDHTSFIVDSTCADTTDPLRLGDDAFADFSNSRLDEFALYSTSLSAARVLVHYNAAIFITPAVAWLKA